mmetsp:Transcript_37372/g.98556  ORF Transcript_37372/g.98556 Transcript_37372/m.98556 type:complete len:466 (-) Transcript_37372:122-1519(-)
MPAHGHGATAGGLSHHGSHHLAHHVNHIHTEHHHVGLVGEEDANAYVACSKAISYLVRTESNGSCILQKNSMYGAAIAIPQIARSSGWSGSMLALTVRTYLFLAINFFLQILLMAMIGEEVGVMNNYAGKMHLCDLGAGAGVESDCASRPNCVGPAGTMVSAPRLYDFDIWNLRMFAKLSIESILPNTPFIRDEVDKLIDPGEWGIQNYYCRIACVFLFIMAVMDDLNSSTAIATLLWRVPSKSDKWISFDVPQWGAKTSVKRVKGLTELDLVTFKVAGMPRHWKVVNFLLIVVPKTVLWYICCSLGFNFLMETASILGSIMNSLALAFILDMDEMVFDTLTTQISKHMMENLRDYSPEGHEHEESMLDDDIINHFHENEVKKGFDFRKFFITMAPWRLMKVMVLNVLFTLRYYLMNCERLGDGSWVSVKMYLPASVDFKPIQFLFGGMDLDPNQTEPYWSMPDG